MNTISNIRLIAAAEAAFIAVKTLAASSKPGCREARNQIKRATQYGLDSRPWAIVREGGYVNMIGWGGRGVEVLRCVREGCTS